MLEKKIESNQPLSPRQTRIAQVVEAAQGKALKLLDAGNPTVTLLGQNSHVPWLEAGDEVTLNETPEGAIITGRLMREGEHPPAAFQVHPDLLELASGRPLRLRSGESSITLLPDGQIILEGKTITQVAADNLRLRAPMIEAN